MLRALRALAMTTGLIAMVLQVPVPVFAAVKTFSGGGDGTTWHDISNWVSPGVPAQTDAVTVDKVSANLSIQKDFTAQSITVGGRTTSTLSAESFVFGTIVPTSTGTSTPAILIRKGGTVVLHGSGTIKLKGPFKNTEESLPTEPSVQILLQ